MKGRLIVIDGTDGSGKATQTTFLVDRMKNESLPVQTMSFPQYGNKSAGALEEYLEGKYGSADEVTAYQASVLFSVDRFDAKKQIEAWLADGQHVILDRYVGSNMGHQGAKMTDAQERLDYFMWNDEFEHSLMQLPRPDINIVLHVPTSITVELMRDRALKSNLEKDVHESDQQHLEAASQAYQQLTKQFDNFTLVDCVENNELLSREAIHERIWSHIIPLVSQ